MDGFIMLGSRNHKVNRDMSNSRKKRRDLYKARQIHWEDVWEMPLHLDCCDSYAYSQNDTMALTFEADTEYQIKNARRIVAIINGEAKPNPQETWVKNGPDFYTQDQNYEEAMQGWHYVFCARGWGHLTGTGAMNLPYKEAERIQDEFCDYILSKLNSNEQEK